MLKKSKNAESEFPGERLRKWRKSLPLKSYELAKTIRISPASLSDIENGNSLPSANTLTKLFLNTNVNIIWVLTGQGSMTRKDNPPGQARKPDVSQEKDRGSRENEELLDLIEAFVRIYRNLPEKREYLIGLIKSADPGE